VVGRTDWTCTVTQLAGGVLAGGAGVGIMVGDKGTLTVTMSAGGVPTVTLIGKAMITKVSPVVDINTGSVEKFEIEFKGDVAAIGEILTWTGNAALTVPMSAKYTTVAWA
jgi:hypothetical protein